MNSLSMRLMTDLRTVNQFSAKLRMIRHVISNVYNCYCALRMPEPRIPSSFHIEIAVVPSRSFSEAVATFAFREILNEECDIEENGMLLLN